MAESFIDVIMIVPNSDPIQESISGNGRAHFHLYGVRMCVCICMCTRMRTCMCTCTCMFNLQKQSTIFEQLCKHHFSAVDKINKIEQTCFCIYVARDKSQVTRLYSLCTLFPRSFVSTRLVFFYISWPK